MTPEEQQRLATVEAETRALRAQIKSMDEKLDRLCEIAAMGKGAWFASLRIGALLVLIIGAAWAVYTYAGQHR